MSPFFGKCVRCDVPHFDLPTGPSANDLGAILGYSGSVLVDLSVELYGVPLLHPILHIPDLGKSVIGAGDNSSVRETRKGGDISFMRRDYQPSSGTIIDGPFPCHDEGWSQARLRAGVSAKSVAKLMGEVGGMFESMPLTLKPLQHSAAR